MTITAQTSKTGPYTGNGSTTDFDFTFYVHDVDDLLVVLLDAAGTQTVLTLNTDYTATGAGNQLGGTISLSVPPEVGEKLIIARQVDLTQEVDLQNRGAVNPETLEAAFDKLTQIAQDQQEQLSRAILIDRFDPSSAADFVADVAALTASAADIQTVADNIGDVNIVATNIDAVIAAGVAVTDPVYDSFQLSGGTGAQGTMTWNADEETVDLVQNGAVLQIGQEAQWHCRNNTASTIANGTPVMATGTLGASGRITIAPMDGTNAANARFFLGIATEDIPAGQDGKITHFGKVRGLNTTAWLDGDVLYLSTTTVGALTKTAPTTGMKIATAFVIHSHATNGVLAVRVDVGDENAYQPKATVLTNTTAAFTTEQASKLAGIEANADVTDDANVGAILNTSTATNGQVLSWNGTDYDWVDGGGAGTVTSVGLSAPTGFSVTGSPVTGAGTISFSYASGYQGYTATEAIKLAGIEEGANVTDASSVAAAGAVMTSAIGVSVQAYSAVLAATTASFTTALKSKLDGIEAGADVTDAANVDAAGAVMNYDIGVSVQAYSSVLANTTASFTTAYKTTLDNLGTAASLDIAVGTTAPSSPAVGDLWVDTN